MEIIANNLSATTSVNLPYSDVTFHFLARYPSSKSVITADINKDRNKNRRLVYILTFSRM
jgi:hypothetical protein